MQKICAAITLLWILTTPSFGNPLNQESKGIFKPEIFMKKKPMSFFGSLVGKFTFGVPSKLMPTSAVKIGMLWSHKYSMALYHHRQNGGLADRANDMYYTASGVHFGYQYLPELKIHPIAGLGLSWGNSNNVPLTLENSEPTNTQVQKSSGIKVSFYEPEIGIAANLREDLRAGLVLSYRKAFVGQKNQFDIYGLETPTIGFEIAFGKL